jgi:predicted ATPase
VAARAPQVVVLDDLHAADPSSLQLLHFLVRDLRADPLLLIGTHREAEARLSADLARLLALIAREATVLPLRRLDRGEVADYVAQATGAAPDPARVAALHERSEGNPLFLRELLQLQEAGRQPEGIRELVRARLALLGPVVRRGLEAAAVLGREFSLAPLAALAEAREPEVADILASAADAGIVEPMEPPARWRFTHMLLREGLYGALPPERRAALHRAAAAEMRRRDEPQLAELCGCSPARTPPRCWPAPPRCSTATPPASRAAGSR